MDLTIEKILELKGLGTLTWAEIGAGLGITGKAAKNRYQRWQKKNGGVEPEETEEANGPDQPYLIFQDQKTSKTGWRDILNLAITTQDLLQDLDTSSRIATVEIDTDKPVAVVYTADWHLGDAYTDHRQWLRDIETITCHPYVKMLDLGDDRQNARSFKTLSAVLGQAISPPLQARMMMGIVDELTEKDKLIAKVSGNHDEEFDERIFGEALQNYLLSKMKAVRFKNKGLLNIKVGNQCYFNLLFHKSRFSSFMRSVHGSYRAYQLDYPAEIVAGGHDHQPGFELLYHYMLAKEAGMDFGGETYLLKVGTYQDSIYGRKYFSNGGFPWNGLVIFWPNEHKKAFFPSIQDGIKYLDYLHSLG